MSTNEFGICQFIAVYSALKMKNVPAPSMSHRQFVCVLYCRIMTQTLNTGCKQEIKGALTAKNSYLIPVPCTMIEVCNEEKVFIVSINEVLHNEWTNALKIGSWYKFSEMYLVQAIYQGQWAEVWQPSADCVCSCTDQPVIFSPSVGKTIRQYSGIVTRAQPHLSLYKLDDDLTVCTAFIDGLCSYTQLYEGQRATVYNAHEVSQSGGRTAVVLCGRSSVELSGAGFPASCGADSLTPVTPVATALRLLGSGFADFLPLVTALGVFRLKFPPDFLSDIVCEHPEGFHAELFLQTISLCTKSSAAPRIPEELSLEFIKHPYHCAAGRKIPDQKNQESVNDENFPKNPARDLSRRNLEQRHALQPVLQTRVLTLQQLHRLALARCASPGTADAWAHCVTAHSLTERAVVGFLSVCPATGRWQLRDATLALSCLLANCSDCPALAQMDFSHQQPVVLLRRFSLVVETGQCGPEARVYLHAAAVDIHVLRVSALRRAAAAPTAEGGPHHLALLHEQSAALLCNGTALCALLVSPQPCAKETRVVPQPRCLLLALAPLFPQLALLRPGALLRIQLPAGCRLAKGRKTADARFGPVPYGAVLTLPAGAQLQPVTGGGVTASDTYSVCAALQQPSGELLSVEGWVSGRTHRPCPADHPTTPTTQPDFGLPEGVRAAVVRLQDPGGLLDLVLGPGADATRLYPLGLVPGARVLVRCAQLLRCRGRCFLRAGALTRCEVLALGPGPGLTASSALPGPLSRAAGSLTLRCLCTCSTVERAAVSVQCRSCSLAVWRGACRSLLCTAALGSRPGVRLDLWLRGSTPGGGSALVHVRGEQARCLLAVPAAVWACWLAVAQRTGGCSFHRDRANSHRLVAASHAGRSELSPLERVLRIFLQTVPGSRLWSLQLVEEPAAGDRCRRLLCVGLEPAC